MAEEDLSGWRASEPRAAPGETVAQHQPTDRGTDNSGGFRALAAELYGALRDAATATLEAHKQLAASETAEVGEAVRRFGQSVDRTQSRVIEHYGDEAARVIGGVAQAMRERSWGGIAADAEEFARRRPALFVLAAFGTGFAVGRLLTTAAEHERRKLSMPAAVQPAGAQTAAPRIEEVL
jgi:hypothetical protein